MNNFVETTYKLNVDTLGNIVDFSKVRWMRNETFDRFHDAAKFIVTKLSELSCDDIAVAKEREDGFTPVEFSFEDHWMFPVWIEREEDVYNEYEF